MHAADMFLPNLRIWRQVLTGCLNAMSDEQLNWVPPGGVNSSAWCVRHLAQSEDWFVNAVAQGLEKSPRRSKELQDRAALQSYLDEVWANTDARFAEWDIAYLLQPRTMPSGYRGQPVANLNVLWVANQVQQHLAFHTGQVRMMARMQGLEPEVGFS